MRAKPCEFFAQRPGAPSEEPRRSRGFYRFLDASDEGVRSFSLGVQSESVSSLLGAFEEEALPKKVFFPGFPGRLDEEFGPAGMEAFKGAACEKLGLEAVFFEPDVESVPRILQDRAQEIIQRRLLAAADACAAACVDLSSPMDARQAWVLGLFSGARKPVVGYGEVAQTRPDPSRDWTQPCFLACSTVPRQEDGVEARRLRYEASLVEALTCLKKEFYFSGFEAAAQGRLQPVSP